MPDARFRWPPRAIRFAQEALGQFSGRGQLTAKESISPTTIKGFERSLGIAYFRRKLADASEGGFRFVGRVALGPQDSVAIVGLQFKPLRATGGVDFYRLIRRERLEQRLRFRDLRKLRGRRKAFQRRSEHVVGVDRAAGGLVEFC